MPFFFFSFSHMAACTILVAKETEEVVAVTAVACLTTPLVLTTARAIGLGLVFVFRDVNMA